MSTTLISGGRPITMHVFEPAQKGGYPAVIVLHGSAQFAQFDEGSTYGQLLADQGFVLYVPRYFEATRTIHADPETILHNYPTWLQVIDDTITYVAGQQGARGPKIALLGFSLGAYLALGAAAKDERVSAVVDFYGGFAAEHVGPVKRMPPVLILHGDADRTVPVDEAHKLADILQKVGAPFEIKIYPGAGHSLEMMEMIDAGPRIIAFLKKYLGTADEAGA